MNFQGLRFEKVGTYAITLRLREVRRMRAVLAGNTRRQHPVPVKRLIGKHLRRQSLAVKVCRHLRLRRKRPLRRGLEVIPAVPVDKQYARLR